MFRIRRQQVEQLLVRYYKSNAAGYHGYQPKATVDKVNSVKDFDFSNCINTTKLSCVIDAYREHGHTYADKDPLNLNNNCSKEFEKQVASLEELFEEPVNVKVANAHSEMSFTDFVQHLKQSYCQKIGYDINHLKNEEEKQWFYEKAESSVVFDDKRKIEFYELMTKAQMFEKYLAKKFPSFKRYSGEGAESMLTFFDELFYSSVADGVEEVLLANSHRGRVAFLTGMLNYPYSQMFHKIKGNSEFSSDYRFLGDVVSHLTSSTEVRRANNSLHVTMVPNPSHLECGNPVVSGKTRGRYLSKQYGHYGDLNTTNKLLSVQIHGDAAMAGQGIVMETFCTASLPHFDIGGSIHLVVNNQVGFTTPMQRNSTSEHCSDLAKAYDYPVLHVNGDHPEEAARAARIAVEYRNHFHKDIMINLHCFRRWGHNELDDPTFTNPAMYKVIHNRLSVPDMYMNDLIQSNVVNETDIKATENEFTNFLNKQFEESDIFQSAWQPFQGAWKDIKQASNETISTWDTGCDDNLLKYIGSKSTEYPEDFSIHPTLEKTFVQARLKKIQNNENIDWATAESLAIGSLLVEGHHVRLCGQDVGRGTFSHRHAMLVDQQTDEIVIPLNNMNENQAFLEVVNSPLSEEAVLAFEYGFSSENPNHLVIWEAQFGDFFNGAQIIIDTFISSGEVKWLLQSGLVMLLPHGMDGAGPDHSSCKIERFLQLTDSKEDAFDTDDVNMQIANPTTPAQYFHLLRRQIVRNYRKPLIIAAPKQILRMSAATSTLDEMQPATNFQPVIGDNFVTNPSNVTKLVFCSGKHYYDLDKLRKTSNIKDVAILRLESLVPFPAEDIKDELKKYSNAKEFIWSQEEHRNQGPWSFIHPRFTNLLNVKLSYNGRDVLAMSAVGVVKLHAKETEELFKNLF